jgi:hypothetical protein
MSPGKEGADCEVEVVEEVLVVVEDDEELEGQVTVEVSVDAVVVV